MKTKTIKVGDEFLVNRQMKNGVTMPELATVIELKRNLIRLRLESGDIIVLLR